MTNWIRDNVIQTLSFVLLLSATIVGHFSSYAVLSQKVTDIESEMASRGKYIEQHNNIRNRLNLIEQHQDNMVGIINQQQIIVKDINKSSVENKTQSILVKTTVDSLNKTLDKVNTTLDKLNHTVNTINLDVVEIKEKVKNLEEENEE